MHSQKINITGSIEHDPASKIINVLIQNGFSVEAHNEESVLASAGEHGLGWTIKAHKEPIVGD